MFARAAAFFVLALPILATASAIEARDNCNTGSTLCCNSLESSTSTALIQALGGGLLGLSIAAALGNLGGAIGLTCTPLTVGGLGGNSCSSQPVCCTNNSFNGAIAAGCTPINISG